eukprot:6213679-Pleurochrysis_carterae.AAC.1
MTSHEGSFLCICGPAFTTFRGLQNHMAHFCAKVDGARSETFTASEADVAAGAKRAAEVERDCGKRTRSLAYADQLRHQVAMDLAQLRYVSNWLLAAANAIAVDVADALSMSDVSPNRAKVAESINESVRSKLDLFAGIRTEYRESQHLQP